tara:strand:- start:3370 stop:3609 length:240 start_codon:yes stop_codon:yes gene_type:complete
VVIRQYIVSKTATIFTFNVIRNKSSILVKLVEFNKNLKFQTPFIKYIKEWKNEIPAPGEDYYKMYSMFLENYEESITKK